MGDEEESHDQSGGEQDRQDAQPITSAPPSTDERCVSFPKVSARKATYSVTRKQTPTTIAMILEAVISNPHMMRIAPISDCVRGYGSDALASISAGNGTLQTYAAEVPCR